MCWKIKKATLGANCNGKKLILDGQELQAVADSKRAILYKPRESRRLARTKQPRLYMGNIIYTIGTSNLLSYYEITAILGFCLVCPTGETHI